MCTTLYRRCTSASGKQCFPRSVCTHSAAILQHPDGVVVKQAQVVLRLAGFCNVNFLQVERQRMQPGMMNMWDQKQTRL